MKRAIPPALFSSCFIVLIASACSDKGSGGTGEMPDGGSGADANMQTYAVPWDWAGVVGTGQSLSVGALASNPTPAAKVPHDNLKLSLGGATVPPFDSMLPALTMVPLVEPIRGEASVYPSAYPANIYGETPHTAMADQITAMVTAAASRGYVTVHTVVGESGQGINVINKTATEVVNGTMTMGRAYAATLFEANAINRLAGAAGKTYGVGAIIITHGETDSGNATYEADLHKLWSDYNADLAAATMQTQKIPLLISQQNSVPSAANQASASTVAQWKGGVDYPGDLVCVGPKYQYPYLMDASGYIHLNNDGYDQLGEKFGQVYFERVVAGHDWQPLQPISATIDGKVITVRFHVPVPPLVLDDSTTSPHPNTPEWVMGRGFEVRAASAPQTIDTVEIAGDDTVKITVRSDLTGNAVTVGYALTTDGVALVRTDAAMTHGTYRWGHLRDSDPFVGAMTGVAQPNWCVSFSMPVP